LLYNDTAWKFKREEHGGVDEKSEGGVDEKSEGGGREREE
jgi:hypothetical protein